MNSNEKSRVRTEESYMENYLSLKRSLSRKIRKERESKRRRFEKEWIERSKSREKELK